MRYLLALLLLTCLTTACTAEEQVPPADQPAPAETEAEAATNPAHDWLEKVEHKAADIETLTATLRYDNNQLLLGDEQRRFGTLHYQAGPPPKFIIHFNMKMVDGFQSRPNLYYIYDGHWLLKRDEENKSAVRYQLVPEDEEAQAQMELGEGPFPIPLNLKKDKVLAKFDVELLDPAEDDPQDSIHLKLTPHEDYETDLTQIDLWFDKETVLPVLVSSIDESQTQTIVKLTKITINEELLEEKFDTNLPQEPGWQLDENRLAPEE